MSIGIELEESPSAFPEPFLFEPSPGSYAMFLPPDLSSIKYFRAALRKSLRQHNFKETDILSIELAADEALTNSIAASVNNHSEETIISRWIIQNSKLTMYIVDYGSGFVHGVAKHQQQPADCLDTLVENFKNYQRDKQSKELPLDGKMVPHKNIGKGLKIIHSLMDSVKIFFHGDGILTETNPAPEKVMGSIMEMEYDSEKHN